MIATLRVAQSNALWEAGHAISLIPNDTRLSITKSVINSQQATDNKQQTTINHWFP